MRRSQLGSFISLFLISLGVVFLILYILIIAFFSLDLTQKIIIFINFLIIFIIFYFLVLFLRKKIRSKLQIKEVEVPVIKEVIKEVKVPVIKEVIKEVVRKVNVPVVSKVEAPKERNYKYYGSKEANTYHLRKCRFSGMIKKPHLVLRNTRDYFKKNKFRPCKNCNPHKN